MTTGRLPSIEGGIQPTIITAKGNLITATAASTPAVLTVGSNNQVLTADSTTATGLKWATAAAGGMTTISTASVSGSSQSFTSIANTYKHLLVVIEGVYTNSANWPLGLTVNDISTATYTYDIIQDSGGTITAPSANDGTSIPLINVTASSDAQYRINGQIWFYNYATSGAKNIDFKLVTRRATQGFMLSVGQGFNTTTDAISKITLTLPVGNYSAGTMTLYGVS